VRLSGYAWRHRDFTQLPCLSVRALSHPHPGARVGFVYSASRISGIFSGFLISFALLHGGVPAALALVAGCVGLVALSVGLPGSKTRGQSLEVICGDDDHAQAPEGPAALPTLLPAQSK
jgi:hypothetical protein